MSQEEQVQNLHLSDIVNIYCFREMDLTNTVAILGVPEGTAKAWLHRGREMLRHKLVDMKATPAMVKEMRV